MVDRIPDAPEIGNQGSLRIKPKQVRILRRLSVADAERKREALRARLSSRCSRPWSKQNDAIPTLAVLGVSRNESSRWQQLAKAKEIAEAALSRPGIPSEQQILSTWRDRQRQERKASGRKPAM